MLGELLGKLKSKLKERDTKKSLFHSRSSTANRKKLLRLSPV